MIENHESDQPLIFLTIDQLHFDPMNPRLPSFLNSSNDDQVLMWMLDNGGVTDLIRSIGEQGYFVGEPLLVVHVSDTQYTVVEGNRRLAALKLLRDPGLAKYRQSSISRLVSDAHQDVQTVPCILYKTRDEILDYLGFRHVTGIKSWSPLAKARYLETLSSSSRFANVEDETKYRQLAKIIGSRIDYVKRILAGKKLYDHIEEKSFYNIGGLDEKTISFSLVTTALGHPNIWPFIGLDSPQDLEQEHLDSERLEDLTRWIFEKHDGRTRLGESRHFGDLNKILASETALLEFQNGRTLQEALIFTDEPVENIRSLLTLAKENLQDSLDKLYLVRDGFVASDRVLSEDIRYLAEDIEAALAKRVRRSPRVEPEVSDK